MLLPNPRPASFAALLLAAVVAGSQVRATSPNTVESAEHSMRQFVAKGDAVHPYKATRRLEARQGDNVGWIEAATDYAPETGFRYTITSEGGSERVRNRVLRAVLDGERELVAKGEMARSALLPCNYEFQATGVDENGLAKVLLSPKRKERVLIDGALFLRPVDGEPVRVQGRLAKSPSWWIKSVDVTRIYDRIDGVVMPVALESKAQVRILGEATLKVTFNYSEIDGRPVTHR